MKRPAFMDALGFEIERSEKDGIVLRMAVPDDLMSPFGQVHGGAIAALFDTGLAVAVHRHLALEDRVATHSLSISYVAFSAEQLLRCHARVVRVANAVATAEGEVMTGSGKLVAKALGTFGVRRSARR